MAHAVHADGRAAGPPLRRGDRMPPALDQTRGHDPPRRGREQNPQTGARARQGPRGRCRRAAEHGRGAVQSGRTDGGLSRAPRHPLRAVPRADRSPALRGRSGNREHPALPHFRGSGASRTAGRRPGRGHAPPGRGAEGRRAASLHHPPRLLHGGRGARLPALLF